MKTLKFFGFFATFAFVILLSVATICCWPFSSNDENTSELEFNDMLRLILAKYMEDGEAKIALEGSKSLENQTIKLKFVSAALLLREIEKNFVENLAKNCAEQKSQNWTQIFQSLQKNFQTMTGRKSMWWRIDAKQNARMVLLLLSFGAQLGFSIGTRELKKANGTDTGRFVQTFKCLNERKVLEVFPNWNFSKWSSYVSASFVVDEEKKVLNIKFDPEGDQQTNIKKDKRQDNFKLLIKLMNQKGDEIYNLTECIIKKIAEEWTQTNIGTHYFFNRSVELDLLLMAWVGISDQHDWLDKYASNANLLFLLKRFGHGLAQRLLESHELLSGYFQLHLEEKIALKRYIKKLEVNLSEFSKKAIEGIHYEDAINIITSVDSDELNLYTFDKRIRRLLARYVDDKKTKNALVSSAESTENNNSKKVTVRIPVVTAVQLIMAVEKDFVTKSMIEKCKIHGSFSEEEDMSEDLAKFRKEFLGLTEGRQMSVEKYRTRGEQLEEKDDVQALKLLLSFVLQLGYTVGTRALKLEKGEQQLSQFLQLHTYLERFEKLKFLPPHQRGRPNSVYLDAQFEYAEGEKDLTIEFGAELDKGLKRVNFLMLKNVFETKKWFMGRIIALLKYLDKKRPNESFRIDDEKPLDDEDTFEENVMMKKLMKLWSNDLQAKMFKSNAAFYLLKRFGRDLGQRFLFAAEQSKFFPTVVRKSIEELVIKLDKDVETCLRKLNENDWKHLKDRPPIHFEDVMRLEPGLNEVAEAKETVKRWPKALNEMNEQTCGSVILDIYTSIQHFATILFREKSDLTNAVSFAFKDLYICSTLVDHEKAYAKLNERFENCMEPNLKKAMVADQKKADEELEMSRKICFDKKDLFMRIVEPVTNELENLETKITEQILSLAP